MGRPHLNLPHNPRSQSRQSRRQHTLLHLHQSLEKPALPNAPGDFILIEMGHNDESDPSKSDKYSERGTLPGLGDETKLINTSNGRTQVYTFGHYLRSMIEDAKKAGAVPIVSGMVPRNYWSNGKVQSTWPFTDYARQQATKSGVEFLDHTRYSVRALQDLGSEKAGKLFPEDRTHTGGEGARLNAETFVQAIKCGKSQLVKYLSDKGKTVKPAC